MNTSSPMTIRNLGLFTLGVLMVLGLGELFLRNADIIEVSRAEAYPDIGKGYRAQFPYTYFSEGFAMGTINAHRYLGPPYSHQKEAEAYRIALVGDSYVEGLQVFERHHFRKVLETSLNQPHPNHPYEVLNFGQSNFHIGNMFAYHQLMVREYKPDITLWFLSADDLIPQVSDPLLPTTFLSADSQLHWNAVADSTPLPFYQATNQVLQYSWLASLLNADRRTVQALGWRRVLFGESPVSKNQTPDQETPPLLTLPLITRQILQQLPPSQTILIWRELSPPPIALQTWAEDLSLDLWHIAPPLRELFEQGKHPFYWPGSRRYGHWNPDAHHAIGTWLASKITQAYSSPSSTRL